jgi:hypothetical protein
MMRDARRAFARWSWVLAVCAACGGKGPTAPTETGTPAMCVPISFGSAPPAHFTFRYQEGVGGSDRELIENAAALAQRTFEARFGRGLMRPVTFDVRAASGGSFAGNSTVTLNVLHQGWTGAGVPRRTRIVAHEMFHLLQVEYGWPIDPNRWLWEGAAEYAGFAAAIDGGMVTYDQVKTCENDSYFGSSSPPLEQLDFTDPSGGSQTRYIVAWLAVDRLVGGYGGISRLTGMWDNAGAWDQRFEATFGKTPGQFYQEFAQYRQTLRNSQTGCRCL